MRHLEENSNEKLTFENQISRAKEENKSLRAQIEQMATRFEEMENTIQELSKKE